MIHKTRREHHHRCSRLARHPRRFCPAPDGSPLRRGAPAPAGSGNGTQRPARISQARLRAEFAFPARVLTVSHSFGGLRQSSYPASGRSPRNRTASAAAHRRLAPLRRSSARIGSSAGQNAYCPISSTVIQRMSLCSSFRGVPAWMEALNRVRWTVRSG